MNRILAFFVISLVVTTQATQPEPKDFPDKFASQIAPEYRADFNSTYKRLLSAQQRQDWDSVYEMVLPENRKNVSGPDFQKIHRAQEWTLLSFKPIRLDQTVAPTAKNLNGRWDILGNITIHERGKRRSVDGLLTIYLIEGVWYADEVGIIVPLH